MEQRRQVLSQRDRRDGVSTDVGRVEDDEVRLVACSVVHKREDVALVLALACRDEEGRARRPAPNVTAADVSPPSASSMRCSASAKLLSSSARHHMYA